MQRYFVRTPDSALLGAVAQSINAAVDPYFSRSDPRVMIAGLPDAEVQQLLSSGAEIIASRQYEPVQRMPADHVYQPLESHPKNLNDVLRHIQADGAWSQSRGAGVHIAVVDTGVCGAMPEFPDAKKSLHAWAAPGVGSPWADPEGHGSMTACVAAATAEGGGRYNGVAPDATLIACKTTFDDTELYQIYDHLIQLVEGGKIERLVVNNSYGLYTCAAPDISPSDPFPGIIRRAVSAGIVVVFAAGNNHVKECVNDPQECGPNSIWGVNSLDEVITVGTVNEHNRMDSSAQSPGGFSHQDSSRGPGQLSSHTTKPDCVAPTYGEVMWGCGYTPMEWWGTSGAAPQVSGLAALLLSKNPALTPGQIRDIITETCVSLPLAATCAGAGLIDCRSAVSKA